jgi:signal transduction histidine kinase/DNA-binding response OmpR family regulator/ligand-binding sensor domain-containing protein
MIKFLGLRKLTLYLFLVIATMSWSQQIVRLDSNSSAIRGEISAFAKDNLGFMWIGSDQGIKKYSGFSFKSYQLPEIKGTSVKDITGIINHQDQLYVLAKEGYLYKYNFELDAFEEIYSNPELDFLSFVPIENNLFVIGLQKGFVLVDISNDKFSTLQHKNITYNRTLVYNNERLYAATSDGVVILKYIDEKSALEIEKTLLFETDILNIGFDKNNRLWIGTESDGLFVFQDDKVEQINISELTKKSYAVRKISFDNNNNTVVSIDRLGVYVIAPSFTTLKKYSHKVDEPNSISQNSIYSIFIDEKNTYWLGTRERGVNLIIQDKNVFSNIQHIQNDPHSIHSNNIRSIFQTPNGDLWFGTENGLTRKKFNHEKWVKSNPSQLLDNAAILSLSYYENHLLIGTYGEGILQLNLKNNKISKINFQPPPRLKFVFNIHNSDGDLFLGGSGAPLHQYRDGKLINTFSVGLERTMVDTFDDILFVGSDLGLFEINKRNGVIKNIRSDIFDGLEDIYTILFDPLQNCLWIGNKSGLFIYSLSDGNVEHIINKTNEDLGVVYALKRDNTQMIYLGTSNGLWRYDVKKNTFRKFDQQDGVLINEFGPGDFQQLKNGELLFGGPNGAVQFDPLKIKRDEPVSAVYISDFKINGKAPDSASLFKNINALKQIHLKHDQNTLQFGFETPKLYGSKKVTFLGHLKGFDSSSKLFSAGEKITYSSLNPGNYELQIEVLNADGQKGNDVLSLEIIVEKPFWATGFALFLYVLLTVIMSYLLINFFNAIKLRRSNEERIKFFVEVAHDIKTPVSLIQLLVKQLYNQKDKEKSLELIHKNTQNLSEYVNQILDIQKIDRNQLRLSISEVNLEQSLISVVDNFSALIEKKSLEVSLDIKPLTVWFDAKKINRIFYNLISNAIKYSNEGGEIEIQAYQKNDTICIDFRDTGIGIPEKQQQLIFNRFTRGTNVSNKGIPGTGIGLMLSKKIVELHGGKLLLKSKENMGSTFTIVLKKGTDYFIKDQLSDFIESSDDKDLLSRYVDKEKLVLLVEDNEDLRDAIKNELGNDFKIITATNGKEGLFVAISKNPDLIITDVMMPKMDGMELCEVLKTNFKTSHIPVIMLTALSDTENKVKGLKTGADVYIEKPFNVEILKTTIKNLLRSRESLSSFIKRDKTNKQPTPDESFLSDVIAVIERNLTKEELSVDTLCEAMGLSRSSLFRKLKGLIQMSPSDLIIKIKLNHAETLLKKKTNMRISEIAYASGFQDAKYFSTLFRKFYGKTPKEFSQDYS